MKAKIKRTQIITALEYAGLSYLPTLLRNREINTIDKSFFKALNSDINKLYNKANSIQIAFDNLNNRFVELTKEKELISKQLTEQSQFLLSLNTVEHAFTDKLRQDAIIREETKNKLISELFPNNGNDNE
jgi:hypothetical protein